MQDGIKQVEKWGIKWGFRFSVEKKAMFFTKKRAREDNNLKLYGSNIES